MNPLFYINIFEPTFLIALPLGIFAVFIALFIPSMMATPNPRPEAISRAIGCYILKAFGIAMIGISTFPVLYMLLLNQILPMQTLLPLSFIFLIGAGVFLQANIVLQGVDDVSVSVPRAIFHHSLETLGTIVALISGISIVVIPLMSNTITGWEIPVTTLILSMILMLSFSLHIAPRQRKSFVKMNHAPISKPTSKKKAA